MSEVEREYALSLDLEFPEGLAPGEGRERNVLSVTVDGRDRYVLRGSALAGVLRAAYRRRYGEDRRFGEEVDGASGSAPPVPSLLRVPTTVLKTGKDDDTALRHHIRINRHSGSVADKSLFSMNVLPPGTSASTVLWMRGSGANEEDRAFLERIVGLLKSGLHVGGNSARGIGRVALRSARITGFELDTSKGYTAFLAAERQWRIADTQPGGDTVEPEIDLGDDLQVDLVLTIPRGQDLLVGEGQGLERELEAKKVRTASGDEAWHLPGSVLRGVFRSWFTRLAAREGLEVFDKANPAGEHALAELDGAAYGYAGVDRDAKDGRVTCPIAQLFGTLHARGRIHIADAFSIKKKNSQGQPRKHVAVDRVTGGAREGALFDSEVLTSPPDDPVRFETRIRIESVRAPEALWLRQTLQALDLGVLRVGSSKAAGVLCLAEPPDAKGKYKETFAEVKPTRLGD